MKIWGVSFLLILFVKSSFAQMLYPVQGTYNGKSAQGMAIWNDMAYIFNESGHCRVLNLKNKTITREFDLATSDKNPHINNVCFGVEKLNGMDSPAIYVSETNKPWRCFVENISELKPELIQTIDVEEHGKAFSNHNWIVDRENRVLYGINRKWNQHLDEQGNINNIITKYRLPKLDEGTNVTLTENDIIDRFEIIFANGMQDCCIRKGLLYISAGLSELHREIKGAERVVIIVDLNKKKIIKRVDLTYITTNEPEGIDFFGNTCLVFFGQTGGLYKVK